MNKFLVLSITVGICSAQYGRRLVPNESLVKSSVQQEVIQAPSSRLKKSTYVDISNYMPAYFISYSSPQQSTTPSPSTANQSHLIPQSSDAYPSYSAPPSYSPLPSHGSVPYGNPLCMLYAQGELIKKPIEDGGLPFDIPWCLRWVQARLIKLK